MSQIAINVFVNFDGNCRQAVEFYAGVFGLDAPKIMTFGDSPSDPDFTPPPDAKDRVMFTELYISGSRVMFSDTFPGMRFVAGNNVGLTVVSDSVDQIKIWFDRLKVGGEVAMELQETFWSKCYGSLTDRFGIPWQLSHEAGR